MVDVSKAFNRENHNLLVTKLSDMGCPGWLLKVVITFLTNRKMVVRHRGKQSNIKSLSGGGPQVTLLGLFLFLVLINDAGFEGQLNNAGELATSKRNIKTVNQIHLKYVDDMTLAESINLKENLVLAPTDLGQTHSMQGLVMHSHKRTLLCTGSCWRLLSMPQIIR